MFVEPAVDPMLMDIMDILKGGNSKVKTEMSDEGIEKYFPKKSEQKLRPSAPPAAVDEPTPLDLGLSLRPIHETRRHSFNDEANEREGDIDDVEQDCMVCVHL